MSMNVKDDPPSRRASKVKVLVIEDDPSITLGLRINLEAEGYQVSTGRRRRSGARARAFQRARTSSSST